MSLENYTGNISDLVVTNPTPTDPKSQGDDHLRGIKYTLQQTFPGFTGPLNATRVPFTPFGNIAASNVQAAIQELDGETQSGLATKVSKTGDTMTGQLTMNGAAIMLSGGPSVRVGCSASGSNAIGLYTTDPTNTTISGGFGMYCINGSPQYSFWGNGADPYLTGAGMALIGNRLFLGEHYGNVGSEVSKLQISTSDSWALGCYRPSTSAAGHIQFINLNGNVGSISTSGTTTAYTTTSDYRLKTNIRAMENALDKVMQLRPVVYDWVTDNSPGQGFIAHELQTVVPDCVTGEKDAVNEDGSPKYQSVDTSFLVATLVAAVQELSAKLGAAVAEIAALKVAK